MLYFSITISLFIDNFSGFSFRVHIALHGEVPFTSFYNLDIALNRNRKTSVLEVHQPCKAKDPHHLHRV